ncbi:hypothetical protein [Thalassotalea piscium]|uniref:Uncharacterized protein n=1 Tax=Thalassotalea piscium TaxID=1230533 RepID=A0A7X0NIF0_9GAMM|nr:hypothetical protein [Thalassotalea piscium]MBB6544009.1 hypothetical protein [Thalassotalea piscium]
MVESERSKKRRLHTGKERADIFVQMDSFSAYFDGFKEKMDSVPTEDKLIYAYASSGITAIGLQTTFMPILLGYCSTDIAIKNKCNYEMGSSDGGKIVLETTWNSAIQYTMTQSIVDAGATAKIKKMIVSTELPNYWNGSMTIFDKDGSKSDYTWSRSEDGTEYFHSESIGVSKTSSTTFTEYSDCSADVIYTKKDMEIKADWVVINEKTTGKFKYCNKRGCRNGDW